MEFHEDWYKIRRELTLTCNYKPSFSNETNPPWKQISTSKSDPFDKVSGM